MSVTTPENVKARKWTTGRVISAVLIATACVLILAAISIPNLLRSRIAADQALHMAIAPEQKVSDATGAVLEMARRVVQTAEMALRVSDPAAAAQQAADIAKRLGGFVENSQVYHETENSTSAHIVMRVPSSRLDEARAALRQLGKKVDSETVKSADVTGEYVDLEATLRNYRAEEAQYLEIMQRARSVKDTLEVAQRLGEVRGRIERTQAQFNLMSKQVEMSAITVSLRPDAAAIPGLNWSPWQNARRAWRDARQDLADYADAMLIMLLRAPAVLAWCLTVVALAALGWRVLRWTWTRWFRATAAELVQRG